MARQRRSTGALALLAGGALVIVGSLLPWASIHVAVIGTIDVAGTEGDGIFTIVLGLVVMVVGVLCLPAGADRHTASLIGLIAAAVATAMAGYDLVNLERIASHAKVVSLLVRASGGVGLYLVVLGGVVGCVGGIIAVSTKPPAELPPS